MTLTIDLESDYFKDDKDVNLCEYITVVDEDGKYKGRVIGVADAFIGYRDTLEALHECYAFTDSVVAVAYVLGEDLDNL